MPPATAPPLESALLPLHSFCLSPSLSRTHEHSYSLSLSRARTHTTSAGGRTHRRGYTRMAIPASSTSAAEDAAWVRVIELLTVHCMPMALQAAVKLNVLEILASHDQELSASDIVARMQPSVSNPTAHTSLDRILRVLASHGVLSSSLHHEQLPHGQLPVRTYGMTAISRYLAGSNSLRVLSLMTLLKPFTDAWQLLDQSVLEGTEAFTLAHGKSLFLFGQEDPHFADFFNEGMTKLSNLFMPMLLQSYDGFHNVNTLVDIGGGTGTCLNAIVSRYPHIKGINFDLPHVVATSPSYPGVEHVGGDMFKGIPQADAIFMKNILHNWSDKSCVEILKNCYKALAKNGKVIILDIMLSPGIETTPLGRAHSHLNLAMHAFFNEGKERTQQELESIANDAGFGRLHLATQVHDTSVVELYKN